MKLLSICASLVVLFAACDPAIKANGDDPLLDPSIVQNQQTASGEVSTDVPVMTLDEEVYEFGEITQGEKVIHTFKFKNTGKSDLLISSAKGTCGCTVPHFPKQPIAPGMDGEVKVIFSSNNKEGSQNKKVTIVTNATPSTYTVALRGFVITPEN